MDVQDDTETDGEKEGYYPREDLEEEE